MIMLHFENVRLGLKFGGRSPGVDRSLELFPLVAEVMDRFQLVIRALCITKWADGNVFFSSIFVVMICYENNTRWFKNLVNRV